VRERRRHHPGHVELREARGAEAHRTRGVDHHHRAQVRLVLEPLHVELVELAVGLPVEVTELVARRVFLVLGELDALALVG
jgi:hypothetical protein